MMVRAIFVNGPTALILWVLTLAIAFEDLTEVSIELITPVKTVTESPLKSLTVITTL